MQSSFCRYTNHGHASKSRNLILLGASGSVGKSALSFFKQDKHIALLALSVHSSVGFLRAFLLAPETKHRHPNLAHAAITKPGMRQELKELQRDFPHISFYHGPAGLLEMITEAHKEGADSILTAIVGAAGIEASLKAIALGMKLCLANKEALVTAGPVIQAAMRRSCRLPAGRQAVILPVDSEHNSVFRLLCHLDRNAIDHIILTASGGPLRDIPAHAFATLKQEQVLSHPNWSMGAKITVDSAGMINKGLEIIEAHYLFSCPYSKLKVWVHRDSFVHAALALSDGSYLFHASDPEMLFPIAHSLYFPEAFQGPLKQASMATRWPSLAFSEPPPDKFPGFYLCLEAGKRGGTAPAILNAANEVAVEAFLKKEIRFTDIPKLIEWVLSKADFEEGEELNIFLEAEAWSRSQSRAFLARMPRQSAKTL